MLPNNPFEGTNHEAEFYQALASARKTRYTKRDIMKLIPPAELASLVDKIGRTNWIVLNKEGTSCVQDPGTRRPFFTKNQKYAELVASEVGGVAVTYELGLRTLTDCVKPND